MTGADCGSGRSKGRSGKCPRDPGTGGRDWGAVAMAGMWNSTSGSVAAHDLRMAAAGQQEETPELGLLCLSRKCQGRAHTAVSSSRMEKMDRTPARAYGETSCKVTFMSTWREVSRALSFIIGLA